MSSNVSEYAKLAFRIYWLLFSLTDYYSSSFSPDLSLNREKRIWEKGEPSLFPHTRC